MSGELSEACNLESAGELEGAWKVNLRSPYFEDIVEGLKTVEGRVARGRWAQVQAGQVLLLHDADSQPRRFVIDYYYRVVKVVRADDFGALYDLFGQQLLPGVQTHQQAVEIYQAVDPSYSLEAQHQYGVVGLVLEPYI